MKKFINQVENVELEMLEGIAKAHPQHLKKLPDFNVLVRAEKKEGKVALISGGGSGHEPAHAGYVGKGMLDAAVCGDVFASPSQVQIYKAICKTASDAGTLLIIKNYSGDMMNFRNAAHLASEDGITVDYVKVDDDIAVKDSLYTVGRRGVAGTVFVHKIAGAAAEQGKSLAEVKAVAEKVVKNVKSIGFALTSCTVPAAGKPTFDIGEDEMEYGVGIHGEPGVQREKAITAGELAERMVPALLEELGGAERVAVMVNGFGATPAQELYLMNNEVGRVLASKGVAIARCFVGNFMTAIDMAGASVTLLKLDEELEALLNEPCVTAGFHVDGPVEDSQYVPLLADLAELPACWDIESPAEYANVADGISVENMKFILDAMCESSIRNEVPFCELDSHAGDGDFGMSIAKGFRQVKREWQDLIKNDTISSFLHAVSMVIMQYCGGASGPIWGSAFRAAAQNTEGKDKLSVADFAEMMQAAVKGIQATGERSFGRGAVVGDKTLIDALVPCADSWSDAAAKGLSLKEAFAIGKDAAMAGAKETEKIAARMGRAGTVGERSIGYADAGAYGLAVIFGDVNDKLNF